jgi:catalase
VWPHTDYPPITVGRITLDRNPENYFAQIEQAAFEPSALVPGVGLSPDKMLLGRVFAYADTHRYRIGPNYHQLPVNAPKAPVNSYTFDGPMRYHHDGDAAVYAPNTRDRAYADGDAGAEEAWQFDGEVVRAAYELHAEDDDFGQAGTLVREVMDDAQRERLVANITGHLKGGASEEMRPRVFDYWRSVDKRLGDAVASNFDA